MDEALDLFFEGRPVARLLFEAIASAMARVGPAELRQSRTQIAFHRRRAFAWVWMPDRWLTGKTAPLVLSLALSRRDASPRWKEVVEPRPGHWMHHLELRSPAEIDAQAMAWLAEAWSEAG